MDNIKQANWGIIGIPKGEAKEKGIKNLCNELMSEIYPNVKNSIFQDTVSTEGPKHVEPK